MNRRSICYLLAALLGPTPTLAQDQDDEPFYLTLVAPPAPELSPEQALDSFRVADGFRVELVAAEPLVEDPISMIWDEEGRIYVVEMRGFMPDSFGNGEDEPIGSVVRLTDVDGDGRMDEREVIADGLVLPRAIAIVPEGLLIAEPPNLWLCPGELNRARTIDCGGKISLGEYGNQPGSVEHAENALLLALDNWIYNAKSDRKFRLDNGQLTIEPTVFRGQWGLGQDDDGYLYYNTNSHLVAGDLYPDHDAMQASVAPTPGLGERLHRNDEVFSIRVNPGVNRAYLDGVLRPDGRLFRPTAASGVEIYRGDQFPESFYGTAFVPESAGNLVAQLRIDKDDLSVSTEHLTYPDPDWGRRDFLASTDERFRPTETRTGPDGALYVVDMYRGIIQDHIFITEQLRAQALERGLDRPLGMGRIWRVVSEQNSIDYASAARLSTATEDLVSYLTVKNAWWRNTAQRMLVASESEGVKSALGPLFDSDDGDAIVHALWILEGRNELDLGLLEEIIARGDPRLSLHAVRAGCDLLDADYLLRQLDSASLNQNLSNRQAMLFCLRRHFSPAVLSYVENNLDDLMADPYLRVALQTMVQSREVQLIELLIADSRSQSADDPDSLDQADFISALVLQSLTSNTRDPQQIERLLDLLANQEVNAWQQDILLSGFYAASHSKDFQRVVLDAPHPLFATGDSGGLGLGELAIADARSSFTWAGDQVTENQKPLDAETQRLAVLGADLFAGQCASCHGGEGNGIGGLAPSLRGSDRIVRAPEQLIGIVLHGLSGPITVQGEQWNNIMPGMAHLPGFDDEGISGLVTHLRRSWGHDRSPIAPAAVAEMRQEHANRATPWTDAELQQIPINRRYAQFAGRYGGMEFSYNGSALEVTARIYAGPMTEIGEDVFFFEPRNLVVEFDRVVDGRSSAVWVQGDAGKNRVPRREN